MLAWSSALRAARSAAARRALGGEPPGRQPVVGAQLQDLDLQAAAASCSRSACASSAPRALARAPPLLQRLGLQLGALVAERRLKQRLFSASIFASSSSRACSHGLILLEQRRLGRD